MLPKIRLAGNRLVAYSRSGVVTSKSPPKVGLLDFGDAEHGVLTVGLGLDRLLHVEVVPALNGLALGGLGLDDDLAHQRVIEGRQALLPV